MLYRLISKILRDKRGVETLEGAIVMPLILMVFTLIIILLVRSYTLASNRDASALAIRETASFSEDKKGLYDDLLGIINSGAIDIGEKNYKKRNAPSQNIGLSEFNFNNYMFFGEITHSISNLNINNKFTYPLFYGGNFIRNIDITEEALNKLFDFLEGEYEGGSESEDDKTNVFIVDNSEKDNDYEKVYHLYDDCFYMRNGHREEMTKGDARGRGYRVCRICLGRKSGL